MESEFTPWLALIGGAAIGTASALLMALYGRVAGISGMVSGLLTGLLASAARRAESRALSDLSWRAAFLLGMVSAPLVYLLATGATPTVRVPVSTPALLIGGVLVGIGVTLGSGCTSGHGVCGLARLSLRSVVAVGTFMAAAVVTVFVARHLFGA